METNVQTLLTLAKLGLDFNDFYTITLYKSSISLQGNSSKELHKLLETFGDTEIRFDSNGYTNVNFKHEDETTGYSTTVQIVLT
jgi:hypothetical protein